MVVVMLISFRSLGLYGVSNVIQPGWLVVVLVMVMVVVTVVMETSELWRSRHNFLSFVACSFVWVYVCICFCIMRELRAGVYVCVRAHVYTAGRLRGWPTCRRRSTAAYMCGF